MNHETKTDDGAQSSDEIRASLHETRERVAADVSALGDKLSPDNIKAEAKQAIKDKVRAGTQQVTQQVRETAHQAREKVEQVAEKVTEASAPVVSFARANAVPLALIGIGVGWLVWGARNKNAFSTRPNYSAFGRSEVYDASAYDDGEGDLSTSARHKLEQVSDKMRDGVQTVKRAASGTADQARAKAQQARGFAEHTMQEQPLLLGALALGAGLAVGLSIPATESENQLVGQYRDRLFAAGKERAQELRHVAERAAQTAKEAVKTELEGASA